VAVLALLLATSLLPGFRLDTSYPRWWVAVLRLPLIFALALIILRPILVFLTLPLNSLTLGLPSLLFNGLILYLAAHTEKAFVITNYGEAFVGTLVMTAVSAGIIGWLGLDEAYPFYQSVIYRIGRRFGPRSERKPLSGLLILQIDGLSYSSLRQALGRGRMPTISAMLARGGHSLHHWHCGIPSNTPAVQAGMLYGDRHNIPGYRWFDRGEQKMRVVTRPEDLRILEERAAKAGSPLLAGGSCINSFMSGGAAKRLMTVSAVGEISSKKRQGERADFNLFFLSPTAYTKAVLDSLWDYVAGLTFSVIGLVARDRPRLKFSIKRVAQRAVANAFLRNLSFFWLKQDMIRGVPIIYSNFVGYDDVAHHSGPNTYEAQISLAAFDRRFRQLGRRARRTSPIRYEIVLLSDHGQTPSVPFRLLFGQTIEELLSEIMTQTAGRRTDVTLAFDPDISHTASLLAEMDDVDEINLGWAADRSRRALRRITPEYDDLESGEEGPRAVVCVSGSLAHIYFTGHSQPLTLENIQAAHPGLVEALANHPGLGLVAARRTDGPPVALCDDGVRNLITGELAGSTDPLAPFRQRDRWAGELAQLMSYPDTGDLVINGAWLEHRNRIVVLEEQTSSHGGLGGRQTEPFVLLPKQWTVGEMDLESPEALHGLLQRQKERMMPPRAFSGDFCPPDGG
jgi:uncharacterized membrane protein YvlD (DUF360 family)